MLKVMMINDDCDISYTEVLSFTVVQRTLIWQLKGESVGHNGPGKGETTLHSTVQKITCPVLVIIW